MKFVTLLCCINPSVASEDITELTLYETVSAVAPIKNLKMISNQGQVKAFIQVEDHFIAETIIKHLNGKMLKFGKMKVFVSHKKYVAFEKPLKYVLAEATGITNDESYKTWMETNPRFNCVETNDIFSYSGENIENSSDHNYLYQNPRDWSRADIDAPYKAYNQFTNNFTAFNDKMKIDINNHMCLKEGTGTVKSVYSKKIPNPRNSSKLSVVSLQNLRTDRVSCQMLFNLFGCFGNISRLWFIEEDKQVYIEYEQPAHAEAAAKSTKLMPYFNENMQTSLISESQTFEYLDLVNEDKIKFVKGSFKFYRYKDETTQPIKRFTKTLHFTNVSDKLTCEPLCIVVSKLHVPIRIIECQFKENTEQSYIVEFENYQQCLEVLSLLHNRKVEGRKLNVEFIDIDINSFEPDFA